MLLLSFDIEEWFLTNNPDKFPVSQWLNFAKRVDMNTRNILDLLSKKKRRATFFVLGWIAEHYPDLVREIVNQGHQLGFHSMYHQQIFSLTPEEFESDLLSGLELLNKVTGAEVKAYRAPYFSIDDRTQWAIPLLIKHGIEIDSSIIARKYIYNERIPEEPIKIKGDEGSLHEFPLSRFKLFGRDSFYTGSGYFRLLPHQLINKSIHYKDYTMLYFHPRDFDPATMWHKSLPLTRNLMNNAGTGSTLKKFECILEYFPSLSLSEAKKSLINSAKPLPTINLNL